MAQERSRAALVKNIGYTFQNESLLTVALTHTSFVKGDGNQGEHNERLEFLGDAVLELVISAVLFTRHPDWSEGALTKARASIVCESSLNGFAKELQLQEHLLISRGEEVSGGRDKPSILSDALEALIGAIYLDGGLIEAERFIIRLSENSLQELKKPSIPKDYKSALQELAQKKHMGNVAYKLICETGPDHKKSFTMRVQIGASVAGEGTGSSKQSAGQQAAAMALKSLQKGVTDIETD